MSKTKESIYVVVDIGCIECGCQSKVLYVGKDQNAVDRIKDNFDDWSGGGINHLLIEELEVGQVYKQTDEPCKLLIENKNLQK